MDTKQTDISSLPLPPGTFGPPLINETIPLLLNVQGFSQKRHQKYGNLFKTSIFGQKTIYVAGGDACNFILKNENRYFQSVPVGNIKELLGSKSLPAQSGELHRHRRQMISKVFSPQYLENQKSVIKETTDQYFQRWEEMKTFAWYPELQDYSFDIACKLFIGNTNPTLKKELKIWSQGLFNLTPPFPGTKTKKALNSRTRILKKLDQIITERCRSQGDRDDALTRLLTVKDDEGNGLSQEEIKDQLLNLLAAGHETTASGLTSLCLLLEQNPDVLEKSRTASLDYIDCIVKETLRRIPPVNGGFRTVIADCEYGGYRFPKDWFIIFEVDYGHYQDFAHSYQFQPERFQLEPDPFHYLPFSRGERRCLGASLALLEMRLFTEKLVQNYQWTFPKQNLDIVPLPFPHPKDNLQVQLARL
ncbi:MAG: cytochrome P450 [Cyanobacteria bacterium]|nr:cytochrome P450 [Cyanobacteria bacterium GSL.Bin1]